MTERRGVLRPLSFSEDLWQVADLIGEAFADEIASRDSRIVEEIRMLARTASLFKAVPGWEHAIFGNMRGFVWDTEGRIVGTVTIQRSSRSPLVWQVANVAVAEEMRGLGIGQRLVERAIEEIAWLGGMEAVLQVRSDNEVAIHIYEKLGFRATGAEAWWQGVPLEAVSPNLPGKILPILPEHRRYVSEISRKVTEKALARAYQTYMNALFPSGWQRIWEKIRCSFDGSRVWRLGAWSSGRMFGCLFVRRSSRRGKKHEVNVVALPDRKEEWEPAMISYGLRLLKGAPVIPAEVHLIDPSKESSRLLSRYGFREAYSLTTMRKNISAERTPSGLQQSSATPKKSI